jgi:hypothetical protein
MFFLINSLNFNLETDLEEFLKMLLEHLKLAVKIPP